MLVSGNIPPQPTPAPGRPPVRKGLSGACIRCREMKIRCEFIPLYDKCRRCDSTRSECVVEDPKPRTETLLTQLRQKDALITALLNPYRPVHSTPITLAAAKLALHPADRTAHHDALQNTDKPPRALRQPWRARFRHHQRQPNPKYDDCEEWSGAESDRSEDPWDAAAAANGPARPGHVYAHALPGPSSPLGLIARLSLEHQASPSHKRSSDPIETTDDEWGVANPIYFHPGPSANLALRRIINQREIPPPILASGLITWPEAEKIFQLFYQFINPYVSVLDPVLHTCTTVFERCPFLFTVVCAISLRYCQPRPALHKIAMHFAKTAAATALVDGFKSVELVQGYFLLTIYSPPARRWEEDRSWFYGGLATRIAIDLGLHKPTGVTTTPLSERHARELRNRVRTWLICFNVDRSSSTLFGKPRGIHDEKLVSLAKEWYGARYCHPYDLHLVMYAELLRIMSRFHAQVYVDGVLNKNCDVRAVTEAAEAELRLWRDDTAWRYERESDPNDPGCVIRVNGVPFYENYMRLVMYSYGFQDAWKRHGVERGDMFFAKCLQAASAVLRQVINVLAPSGYLKYAPDGDFVMSGFCAAFLLKLLRTEFSTLLDAPQRARIATLVRSLVAVLASPAVSIDAAHTPRLYARFLREQLRAAEAASHTAAPSEPAPSPPLASTVGPPSLAAVPGPGVSYPVAVSPSQSRASSVEEAEERTLGGWPDNLTDEGMGDEVLGVEEYLAAMGAVSNDGWLETMLMPGFKWETGGGLDEGVDSIVG